MKTRDELIEEIAGEFEKRFIKFVPIHQKRITGAVVDIENFLRSALLKISDASMDAMEVEKRNIEVCKANDKTLIKRYDITCIKEKGRNEGWNSARTTSQDKRAAWTKI